ncbi:ribosomal RNA small subunit methyltransferase I [Amylibacter marinus]|uniref:Ribosomal RNA small subunit methyltransferase I n=1 Tax=Amylibacter marinus TaxID=1475483 RepID=A0ABQ5VU83_9RHOB|nr:16S rRNA (cytidine(1402)-2'-O)-methyltransferase [Amylibacter marinus]GLQ35003.1 ribosomal RNA small subunit methyltransferase I [Amylibacter marinus]
MGDKKLPAGLYIVATPIGTADDITLRALHILAQADVLAAEDTRNLRRLMDIHGIALQGRRIVPYHDHNGDAQRPKLLAALEQGKTVAYASDAGTPLIADPGFGLALGAREAGYKIQAAPGASAVLTALCMAGQPTDRFFFGGFLPNKTGHRKAMLEKIAPLDSTLVYYESPKRVRACLSDMITVFGAERSVSLCRELTKKFEEVIRGSLVEVEEIVAGRESIKGEVVLVLGPPLEKVVKEEDIHEFLIELLQTSRVKDAAAAASTHFNIPRKQAYEIALLIKDQK